MAKRGLVIVPENATAPRIKKGMKQGYPREILGIPYIDEIHDYADRHDFGVLYLTSKNRLVYADEVISSDHYITSIRKDKDVFLLWSILVAEEIENACHKYMTNQVYLMNTDYARFKYIYPVLKSKGIEVHSLLCGVPTKRIPLLLKWL